MSDGAYLEISKTVFGSKRTIVIESIGGGKFKKQYYESRTMVNWEPEGREWLAEILRIPLQFTLSTVISTIMVMVGLSFYFAYFIGFSMANAQMIGFTVIYSFTALLYNLLYFSNDYIPWKHWRIYWSPQPFSGLTGPTSSTSIPLKM